MKDTTLYTIDVKYYTALARLIFASIENILILMGSSINAYRISNWYLSNGYLKNIEKVSKGTV